MDIILGSGFNALLTRHLLGPEAILISAGPSRFYSTNPAPADNFIYASDLLRPLENQLKALNVSTLQFPYKCSWSIKGELIHGFDKLSCSFWLSKIFDTKIPTHLELTYRNRMDFNVYGTRVNQFYAAMYDKHFNVLSSSLSIEAIEKITPHQVHFKDGKILDFDRCISTIPLDDLCVFIGNQQKFDSIGVTSILVQTTSLNFEGSNQLFVVDPEIQFFKVVQVAEDKYVFSFLDKIESPGLYLTPYVDEFDLLTGVYHPNSLPAGPIISTRFLDAYGIIPVGMSSQWDPAMDISSCIYRILKIVDGEIR